MQRIHEIYSGWKKNKITFKYFMGINFSGRKTSHAFTGVVLSHNVIPIHERLILSGKFLYRPKKLPAQTSAQAQKNFF